MNTYGFRFIRYFLLFLALLFSFSFLFGWWKSQPVATPVSVGIGIDLPLIEATAIDPSDWNTSQIFTEKNTATKIQPHQVFIHPLPERAKPDLAEAIYRGINFFILPHSSTLAVEILPLFDDGKALGIVIGSSSLMLSKRDDYLLRIIPDLQQEQLAMAEHISSLPGNRLLVIQDIGNPLYTEPALEVFLEAMATESQWEITVHPVLVTHFKPTDLKGIISSEYDALYILAGAFMLQIGNISQLFHHANPSAPIILTTWTRAPGVLHHSGAAIDNINILSIFPSRKEHVPIDDFLTLFESRFGYLPIGMSLSTWQALELLDSAFAAGYTTPRQVKEFLLQPIDHRTSLGPVRFNVFGDIQSEYFLLTGIKDEIK